MRSKERTQFLADVITTAVEGGIGYWSYAYGYNWADPYIGDNPTIEPFAEVWLSVVEEDNETGDTPPLFHLTMDAVASALGRLSDRNDPIGDTIANSHMANILYADQKNDAGIIDAWDADIIVQVAMFGEVIYG